MQARLCALTARARCSGQPLLRSDSGSSERPWARAASAVARTSSAAVAADAFYANSTHIVVHGACAGKKGREISKGGLVCPACRIRRSHWVLPLSVLARQLLPPLGCWVILAQCTTTRYRSAADPSRVHHRLQYWWGCGESHIHISEIRELTLGEPPQYCAVYVQRSQHFLGAVLLSEAGRKHRALATRQLAEEKSLCVVASLSVTLQSFELEV
eukprot:5222749-Pleurochrysis_carterae.AAC.3